MLRVRFYISTVDTRPGNFRKDVLHMSESIILNDPLLLIGYGIALVLCVLGIKAKVWGYVFPIVSIIFCVLTNTYGLLKGASLYEIGAVLLVFLFVNMSAYHKDGRDNP